MKYTFFLCFAAMILLPNVDAFAQSKRSLNREKWEAFKDDVDYSERSIEKKEPVEEEVDQQKTFEDITPEERSGPDISGLGYILIGVVIVVLLIGIVILINQNNKSAAVTVKRRQAVSIEDAEEELPEVELTDLFQEQLDRGEWRLALRVKFLMILQDLIDKKWIVWQKQKTNRQYVSEVSDTQIRLRFQSIVTVFDQVWYGDAELSKEQFDQVIFTLNSLHNQLNEGK